LRVSLRSETAAGIGSSSRDADNFGVARSRRGATQLDIARPEAGERGFHAVLECRARRIASFCRLTGVIGADPERL